MSQENQLAVIDLPPANTLDVFGNESSFNLAQRMAKAIVDMSVMPSSYKGEANLPNALILVEMASRMRMPILAIAQNLHIIQGRPSWSSPFIIAAVNGCGRFTPLRFKMGTAGKCQAGDKQIENLTCYAWCKSKEDGEEIKGSTISMEMAVREGWFGKAGSKWQTMPEQMLQYRAASFFGRLYAPDILNGLPSADEIPDYEPEKAISGPVLKSVVESVTATVVPEPVADADGRKYPKLEAAYAELEIPWDKVKVWGDSDRGWSNVNTWNDLSVEEATFLMKQRKTIAGVLKAVAV